MNGIYLLLGSNIDDRLAALNQAVELLADAGIHINKHSSVYETAPWGITDQNWFLNVGLEIETTLTPERLLTVCQNTEQQLGRVREIKWGPRIIDIDILYYRNEFIDSASLQVPHPGIPERKFTLILLAELAPKETHPILKKTQNELLLACKDPSECNKTKYQLDIDLD